PSLYNIDDLDTTSTGSGIPASRLSSGSDFDARSSFASSSSGGGGGQNSIDLSSPMDNYSFGSQNSSGPNSSSRSSDAADEVEA
ncbi:U-box domain-containing protein 52-like, partial [Trifolium medium]|nr:U-box domain-containing protein 52-like [Trifolium medium]